MATVYGNVKGIKFLEEPLGSEKFGVALVTFDTSSVYTGGTDTLSLGGGGTDGGASSSSTLATMIQNRRRDGKTVTILAAAAGQPGSQAAATNGPSIYLQSVTVSSSNVTASLKSAFSAGSNVTTTASPWDRAGGVIVTYTAA